MSAADHAGVSPHDDAAAIVRMVRDFVEREVIPHVADHEHEDRYPHQIVAIMAELGFFGLTIPEEHGGAGLSTATYVRVVEELCVGWMSLAGVINSHLLVARIVERFGTDEQRRHYLPRMASGELRGGLGLSEADAGSDAAAIRTRATRDGSEYVLDGAKLWVTNGREGNLVLVAAKTDVTAEPAHRGVGLFLVTRSDGYEVGRSHKKLGYRGVDTAEVVLSGCRVPADRLVGEAEGRGFAQVLAGLEQGRLNVAARAVGVGRAAFEQALAYAQQRETFGKPIAEHQTIQNMLADMATDLRAARLLTASAAEALDRGERVDLEAGMAKLFASEMAARNAMNAMRVHGGVGFTTDLPVERLYRDAPLMLIGEGTSEIQRLVIARSLLKGRR
ncbi:MAG: acyl-CoA dehydrogenase family protein [Micromonosporaceae bacterium]